MSSQKELCSTADETNPGMRFCSTSFISVTFVYVANSCTGTEEGLGYLEKY